MTWRKTRTHKDKLLSGVVNYHTDLILMTHETLVFSKEGNGEAKCSYFRN